MKNGWSPPEYGLAGPVPPPMKCALLALPLSYLVLTLHIQSSLDESTIYRVAIAERFNQLLQKSPCFFWDNNYSIILIIACLLDSVIQIPCNLWSGAHLIWQVIHLPPPHQAWARARARARDRASPMQPMVRCSSHMGGYTSSSTSSGLS